MTQDASFKPEVLAAAGGSTSQILSYSQLATAWSAATTNASVALRVIVGDNGQYWVVSPALATRLQRLGYAYAPRPARDAAMQSEIDTNRELTAARVTDSSTKKS